MQAIPGESLNLELDTQSLEHCFQGISYYNLRGKNT